MGRQESLERLRRAVRGNDEDIDLAGTALLLAGLERNENCLDKYHAYLGELVADIKAQTTAVSDLAARIASLRKVIFDDHGFSGDNTTYDDFQNANLMNVIDRRRGIPVSLGIICIHASRGQGWDTDGINFPSHFLISLQVSGERAFVDPFNKVQRLTEDDLRQRLKNVSERKRWVDFSDYHGMENKTILLRLQNNIRSRAQQAGDFHRARRVVESMSILTDNAAVFRLELATLKAKTGELRSARQEVEALLDDPLAADIHEQAWLILNQLKSRLH
ncbi:MAG: transglutaminase-like domain-containing protein [Pseudomonadota bacterium]|nr:transglutaminase-like domain-containing protein [Pseudomonadota bacterium]